MWAKKTVAVIFPTYREKRSIKSSIEEFDLTGYIDDLIVVDNNAEEGTEIEVQKTRARLIKEPRQGYGRAIKTGIANTNADLIIVTEPDGTYNGKDVLKLLAYSDDFDMVFGTRTHVPLIQKRSEMTAVRRIINVLYGKLICVLYLCSPLTDVGCTLRITSRKGWNKIKNECRSDDSMFATEWLLLSVKNKVNFIEIPVNFRSRVGKSSVMKSFYALYFWAIKIFFYICKVWIYKIMGLKLYHR